MSDLVIEARHLTRGFGDVLAVSDLDLAIPRGSIYGFLGPNGAGKTTTIRLLLGLIRPDRGEIRLLGHPFGPATRRPVLRRIGALVETPSLYPHLTGRENLCATQVLAGWPSSAVVRALDLVGLNRDADRLVKGCSLGMRQRLGLAQALLGQPDLLVLDEPTNGLDPAGIQEMRELIRRLFANDGLTIFLSSHLLGEVEQLATHVGILGRGRRLFQGSLGELQSQRQERLVIDVDQTIRARFVLRGMGWAADARDEQTLIVPTGERREVACIASALVEAGLAIYRLAPERPSLEEVFLDLTRSHGLVPEEVVR